jgi:hypothetical protein
MPPPLLLKERPEAAHVGPAQIVALDSTTGLVWLEPLDALSVSALGAETHRSGPYRSGASFSLLGDPRPLSLLRCGDVIDAQFVRYGQVCWLANLRSVLPGAGN